jgi:tetratricopeptide (TPR) repeat protein
MLKPTKKISKKELKEDTLTTTYVKATAFYEANKKYVNYGVTALVVIVVAVIFWMNNRASNDEKAATQLGKVFPLFDSAAVDPRYYQVAVDGRPERGVMGLKAIVDNYGGTHSGELARFYLANAYFQMNKIDLAKEEFDDFGGDDAFLEASATAGLAACFEKEGDLEKAASLFEKAAGKLGEGALVPEYLNSAGRCYASAGEKDKALSLYKRLKKEFPTSNPGREADRYITQLAG